MEDQPADSGDLTTDAVTASVPQGKSARSRHRLPRQKAAQPDQPDDDASETSIEASDAATEVAATDEVPATEVAATDEVPEGSEVAEGTDFDEEPAGEPAIGAAPRRGLRRPWRRGGGAAEPPVHSVVVDLDDLDEPGEQTEHDEPVADEPAPVLVPHRPAGRALRLVAVAAGVLFVAAAAFAGAQLSPYLADRATAQTKFHVAQTAANAITTLWTYTPDDMEKLPDRSAKYLGGDFAADYKRYIDAIVASNKQAQVSNNTQVLGAAVESLTPTEATAIVYTNSVATSPVTKGIPSLRYLSYRLTMKRQENQWLITQMVAITKLDLTPRL